jgi:hypothetical protein
LTHGNTPVGETETRASFTQYTPFDTRRTVEGEFCAEDKRGYEEMVEREKIIGGGKV